MKVPISSSQHHQSAKPKPVSCNNGARNIGLHTSNSYEPTSVLDLRRSPSPVPGKPVSATENHHPSLEWDEHVVQTFDWDSIMKELDFHEDSSSPNSLIKNFPQVGFTSSADSIFHNQSLPAEFITAPPHQTDPAAQFLHTDFSDVCFNNITSPLSSLDHLSHSIGNNWNNIGDLIQELIQAADCIDSNEIQLARVILDRLNHRPESPAGKPFQRAAFFFKEALQSLLTGLPLPSTRPSSWPEVVQTIKAYKTFSSISPIPLFTHLATARALFETLVAASSTLVHVIDFDIGLGNQYASFMRELAETIDSCKLSSPVFLRITALVTEDYAIETQLIKQCLSQYALELKIGFQIEFVLERAFEMVSFKSIKFMDGEKTAILLSAAFFRRLGSTSSITAFVTDLRRVSQGAFVIVDSQGWAESVGASFRRNFVNSLEFFSMIFDSLDAASGDGGDWARKIEMFLLRPRIFSSVEACVRLAAAPWKEVFIGAGMRQVVFSRFADFQAECLLGKMQARGFSVAKRSAELVGLRLLLSPLGSNIVIRTACCSVGVVVPVYSTFKAIKQKDQNMQQKWLIYWAAYGSFSLVETFADKLISWLELLAHRAEIEYAGAIILKIMGPGAANQTGKRKS